MQTHKLGGGMVPVFKRMLCLMKPPPCEGFIGVFIVVQRLETDLSFQLASAGPETREEPSNSTQIVTLAKCWFVQGLRLEQSHLEE